MILHGALLLVASMAAIYLLFSEVLAQRRLRWIRRVAAIERTRSQWAEARRALFDLMCSGKIDPDSETFRTFYGLQTFVLRRPDAYDAFSDLLAQSLFFRPVDRDRTWLAEQPSWPPEMAAVLRLTADGVRSLLMNFSGRRRLMLLFWTKVVPVLASRLGRRSLAWPLDILSNVPEAVSVRRLLGTKAALETATRELETRTDPFSNPNPRPVALA